MEICERKERLNIMDMENSISEVSRVMKQDGFLFISDPTPNANDTSRFIDGYMQLKKDGHKVFELLQRLDTLQFIAKPYAIFDPINNTSEKLQFSGVKTKICQGGYNENSHYRWKWFW